jgi:hypothetical protein
MIISILLWIAQDSLVNNMKRLEYKISHDKRISSRGCRVPTFVTSLKAGKTSLVHFKTRNKLARVKERGHERQGGLPNHVIHILRLA